ncbi:IS3 family transposase [Agarivorans sp. B2Z047]|uniref:IS3 family transposase n=1 Tax=Agarivorans sp. B2Z047 TaxID=2652721 RepID=UPI0034CE16E2
MGGLLVFAIALAEYRYQREEQAIPLGRKVLCKLPRVKCAFVRDHQHEHSILAMCRVLKINRSGFYAWRKQPLSARAIEDNRLLVQIKTFYVASGGNYGSPWILCALRESGERCSVHRVAKIMRLHSLKAQVGYTRRYIKGSKPSRIADNLLERDFTPDAPNVS